MRKIIAATLMAAALPAALAAQQPAPAATNATVATAEKGDSAKEAVSTQPQVRLQYMYPNDARALNTFEAPKVAGAPYNGFTLDFGAAFTQQFQALDHENTAAARLVNGVNQNALMEIGSGFNNAVANLYLNAQLAPGIRVSMTTYLSSRHHTETWVKDGYILADASPIANPVLEKVMEYVTLKAGHFEINYGDAHFRRTDNGNALYNPFVGNLILDAFTTEIGAEAYFRTGPWLAMAGMTSGEIKGNIQTPEKRGWAQLAKLGFDQQFNDALRVRLTGSMYTTDQSPSNTLYTGDRAGSRYYLVLENTAANLSNQAWSGLIRPGFSNEVTAYQLNPFVEIGDLELFGVIEKAEGKSSSETARRSWNQYAVDGVYRFLDDKLYAGARYNTASGELAGIANDVGVDRWQIAGGWFVTPSLLLKAEYVDQKYRDFPTTDIRNGGKFNGFMIEGVVSF